MPGAILGKDQIDRVNALYSRIRAHVADLVGKAATPFELMKTHILVEHLDTTELSTIFVELPFLSPADKKALVRTAIFDVLLDRDASENVTSVEMKDLAGSPLKDNSPVSAATFTPAPFKLNPATTEGSGNAG